ncbi:hypothetical protein F511_40217 [Dorcoceras hygrometricum]|uniref:Uncharacterized protein n=1 Tax=Dorcoceras hygrometricum TaxID=472368 RepID=A0A2Z7BV66_9LAMI|nr:hypothetical protein F511_40217 [Dorcoceras hygrometricum]
MGNFTEVLCNVVLELIAGLALVGEIWFTGVSVQTSTLVNSPVAIVVRAWLWNLVGGESDVNAGQRVITSMTGYETPSSACTRRPYEIGADGFSSSRLAGTNSGEAAAAATACTVGGVRLEERGAAAIALGLGLIV